MLRLDEEVAELASQPHVSAHVSGNTCERRNMFKVSCFLSVFLEEKEGQYDSFLVLCLVRIFQNKKRASNVFGNGYFSHKM